MLKTIVDILKRNWFLMGIVAAVVLGLNASRAAAVLNPGKVTSTAAVVIIFLLSGLSLQSEQMARGLRNIKAHLFIQGFVFLLVPAYFYLTAWPFREVMDGKFIVGIYALSCLPTTIASCIVFTQMAKGNAATTIFNAVLASMLGVFVSPLILTLMLRHSSYGLPMAEVLKIFGTLVGKVLIPFAAGQLLRTRMRDFAGKHKKQFSKVSAVMILMVVFFAFSRSAKSSVLSVNLLGPLAYLAGSNVLLMVLAWFGARAISLDRGDVVSAVFTAPQKTLAMGIPLLTTYFAADPAMLAVALMPSLFYHPWQLLTATIARNLLLKRHRSGPAAPSDSSPG